MFFVLPKTDALPYEVVLVGVPSAAILANHAEVFIRLLFARGSFSSESVALTASILRGAAFGLWAQMMCYVGLKYLSALGSNRAVLLLMGAGVTVSIGFNIFQAQQHKLYS